jgi:stringent starvation protein B
MTSSRPYLLRALNEWILDNDCTPYIVVDASAENVHVPQEYVNDGQIILNITPASIRNLVMDNESVSFDARFGGQPHHLYVPISAITAIYARENGQGMVFGQEAGPTEPTPPGGGKAKSPDAGKSGGNKPRLKVVK